jgi:DNA-binding PadR family transcriptional regulator
MIMQDWLLIEDFVLLHVLSLAIKEPIIRLKVEAELNRLGYRLSPDQVYSVLHALEEAGYLLGHSGVICGETQEIFEATAQGRQMMRVAKARLHELTAQLLTSVPDPDNRRSGCQSETLVEDSPGCSECDLQ